MCPLYIFVQRKLCFNEKKPSNCPVSHAYKPSEMDSSDRLADSSLN